MTSGQNAGTIRAPGTESVPGAVRTAPPDLSSGPTTNARPTLPPPTTVETWRETPDETMVDDSFVPPLDPSTPTDDNAPDLPIAGEVPLTGAAPSQPGEEDSFWIVSSRSARQPAGAPESSRDLAYLMGAPTGLVRQPRERFLGSLRPDRPVCVVIHGSYNYWPDVLRESRRCRDWIARSAQGQPVQVVFFTWPANGYVPIAFPVELAVLGRRASYHGVYLANLLGHFPPEQPVCLVGHSHGARCAVATLHALGGGAVEDGTRLAPGLAPPQRMRSVLLAAAIDHHWLNPGARYGRALYPVEKILVVHNQADAWLRVYSWKNLLGNSSALGQSGLSRADQFQLDSLNQKVVLLDATRLTGNDHDFAAFNTRAEYADAIAPMVTFTDAAPVLPPAESVASTANLTTRRPVPAVSPVREMPIPPHAAVAGPPHSASGSSIAQSTRIPEPLAPRSHPSGRVPAAVVSPAPPAVVGSEPRSQAHTAARGAPSARLDARAQPNSGMTRGRLQRRSNATARSGKMQSMPEAGQTSPGLVQGPTAPARPTSERLPPQSPRSPKSPGVGPQDLAAGRPVPGLSQPGVVATGVSRASILAHTPAQSGLTPPGSSRWGHPPQPGTAQRTQASAGSGRPESGPLASVGEVTEEPSLSPDDMGPRTPIYPGRKTPTTHAIGLRSPGSSPRRLSAPTEVIEGRDGAGQVRDGQDSDGAGEPAGDGYFDRIPIYPGSHRRPVAN
ncbi:MAG: hypothetical protein ACKOGA_18000 [Planctomycetaceae bacterium]